MFEKIGRLAETMATSPSLSRRSFLGRFMKLAGGAALGATLLMTPTKAKALESFKCRCCKAPFGCALNDTICFAECGSYCASLKRCNPYKKK